MTNTVKWAAAGILSAAIVGCTPKPAPFDPLAMQQRQRVAADSVSGSPMMPYPEKLEKRQPSKGTPTSQPVIGKDERQIRLTLREVIQRTAVNNGDVKVAGYEPAVEQTRTIEGEARFDPRFFTNFQYQRVDRLTGGSRGFNDLTILPYTHSDTWTIETGIRQILESGAQVEAKYQIQRAHVDPQPVLINPTFSNELSLQVTQPLLQNFGVAVNRARIDISRNNQQISLLEFRKTLEEQLLSAEQTYWQLGQALRDVATLEALLERTIKTGDVLAGRAQGDAQITRVQTSQAEASIEQRRAVLVRARARVRDLSDKLKQLMNDPEFPVASNIVVLPASNPLLEPLKFDLTDQIASALDYRLELGQQQLRIESATIAVRVADSNLLPRLDLQGQIAAQGLDLTYGEAFSEMNDYDHISWTIGLQLEIPLGNREARAIWRRAQLQRQQAIDQYAALREQIALDVTTAAREVNTAWDLIVARKKSRLAFEDQLGAIQSREDANAEPLTYNFVQLKLDTQERLANAQQEESQAVNDYNFAIARLERAKGTLLKYNNIIMQEADSPFRFDSKIRVTAAPAVPPPTQPVTKSTSTAPVVPPTSLPGEAGR